MDYDFISKDILEYIRYYNLFQTIFIGHSIEDRKVMKFFFNYPWIPKKKIIIVDLISKVYSSINIIKILFKY
ncbi:hypothetical protein [Blattabacterium sp. (Cryptocercus punctulatus) str. Cpu]|uniref:hypothetical protein n=1 Tax=Blattabacterium sp. (Cryptocercus punctulatus) str. Cpu TaxID=1075399 RepID=UPI0003007E9C|nr:hypothetical protein [Blattabacterium sp. (Cryptocercus punctulatus) str. Cpu]